MFNSPYSNPYQQVAALQNQLQQPYGAPNYQNPYAQQQYQQPAQPNIQQMIQQEIQRQLGNYQQMQQQPQALPPAQPPGVAILSAIGGAMTQNEQQWLSANLHALPAFFNTSEGRELILLAMSSYKKHLGVIDE